MPHPAAIKLKASLRLGRLMLSSPRTLAVIRRVRRLKLTYLNIASLTDLADAAAGVIRRKVPGSFHEAGCALGGSAMVIASVKPADRPFWIYDTFERIPPPSEQDGQDARDRFRQIEAGEAVGVAGSEYYGYRGDLTREVKDSFAGAGLAVESNQILLVKGLFQDTLRIEGPVAFAHLDCDWYDSVMTCLQRIEPRLSPGGVLVIDDYEHWSGCRKAVDEYFADKRERYHYTFKTRLHIQRLR